MPEPRRRSSRPIPRARRSAEVVALHAADDAPIVAVRRAPSGSPRAHVVVAGAIGVPQDFYRRFADHAVSRGHATWTLDYRGVGRSAPPRGPSALRRMRADLLDWGRLDLGAVVEEASAAARAAGVPLWVVGHSFGGLALAMLPAPSRVQAAYAFGTGAGWHGWMPAGERPRVLAMWHLVMPALTRAFGYAPWRMFGAADLPLGVYRQWKRWCSRPGYVFDDPEDGPRLQAGAARLRMPLAMASAHDDRWSPPASRDALLAAWGTSAVERVDIDPRRLAAGAIGHMGYFRSTGRPLWDDALDWLARSADDGGDGAAERDAATASTWP